MALINQWKFDGNVTDFVGSYNGTMFGNIVYPTCPKMSGNYASLWDGASYITMDGLNPYAYTGFTFSFWIYKPVSGNAFFIMWGQSNSPNNRTQILSQTTKLYYNSNNNGPILHFPAVRTCLEAVWHHIAITDNAGTFIIYIDGTYDSGSSYSRFTPAADWFTVGAPRFDGNDPLAGWYIPSTTRLDDLRLYSTALTAVEVKGLYNSYFNSQANAFNIGVLG